MSRYKVFGIGLHKTGTTSLANALYTLGFNVTGFFEVHEPNFSERVYDLAYDLADRYDAFQDTPWPLLYKELDTRYPGSKFILTIRPAEKWIISVVNHFKHYYIPAHEWIYGVRSAQGNEDIYVRRYEQHNLEVQIYFKDRPNDLLVMDISEGDGWEKLCPFLGVDIPPFDFPSQNMLRQRSTHIFIRGIRYLQSRMGPQDKIKRGSQMATGVSSAFLRDIMHFHYSMFETSLYMVKKLTESQFEYRHEDLGASVRDLLWDQICEEKIWLNHLVGNEKSASALVNVSENFTIDSIGQLWKSHQLLVRQYVANLTDADCESSIFGRKDNIWEVFLHLMNFGTEKRFQINLILREFGLFVEQESFMGFFRPNSVRK